MVVCTSVHDGVQSGCVRKLLVSPPSQADGSYCRGRDCRSPMSRTDGAAMQASDQRNALIDGDRRGGGGGVVDSGCVCYVGMHNTHRTSGQE